SYRQTMSSANEHLSSALDPQRDSEVLKMKFCETCKEEFADRFSFCPVDGTPLSAAAAPVVAPPTIAAPPTVAAPPRVAPPTVAAPPIVAAPPTIPSAVVKPAEVETSQAMSEENAPVETRPSSQWLRVTPDIPIRRGKPVGAHAPHAMIGEYHL